MESDVRSILATPDVKPWSARVYPETGDDSRGSYKRDRDRILHCESFRKLQHKTQVFVVHEGDFFRTRLTHSLEVAQIGRSMAHMLGLTEPLIEAICLGHDLGHAPFGHAGEQELDNLLKDRGSKWNSNGYSLIVVEEVEVQYFEHQGLNLTWATREGLALHNTKFDAPVESNEYSNYKQCSLESQAANIADVIAYSTHDVEDALEAKLVEIDNIRQLKIGFWDTCYKKAKSELDLAQLEVPRPGDNMPHLPHTGVNMPRLLHKRLHRHLIDFLIRDAVEETRRNISLLGVASLDEARTLDHPLVSFSPEVALQVDKLLDFMHEEVYKGNVVARQNYRASHILRFLFGALIEDYLLLPKQVQGRIDRGNDPAIEVARFLAGLTDRSASDLYAELFEPGERSMGHRIS